MANIAGSYDENAEPSDFERVPAGTYRAKIIESDVIAISDSKDLGRCLKLTWQIETGPQDNRLVWQRLNMWWTGAEKNPGQVVQIANAQFAEIRQATGKTAPQNSTELHHIPCMITVGPQKKDPNYDEVKSVKAAGGNAPGRQPPAPLAGQQRQAPPPQTNSGGSSAPWPRR